jgi:hypothetical protein
VGNVGVTIDAGHAFLVGEATRYLEALYKLGTGHPMRCNRPYNVILRATLTQATSVLWL